MEALLTWLLSKPELAGWAIVAWAGYKMGGLKVAIDRLIKCHEKNEEMLDELDERVIWLESKAGKRGYHARLP